MKNRYNVSFVIIFATSPIVLGSAKKETAAQSLAKYRPMPAASQITIQAIAQQSSQNKPNTGNPKKGSGN